MGLLEPDRYFARLSRVDIERDLLDCGLKHVLLDVDNTVRNRADNAIPRDARLWIGQARDAGVQLVLFSNSWHDTTLEYGRDLDLPVVMRCCKPLHVGTLRALRAVGGTRRDSVVIGDQIMTDVLSAHLMGMPAYLVVPLSEVNIRSAVWQRDLERRVLTGWVPEGGCAAEMAEASRARLDWEDARDALVEAPAERMRALAASVADEQPFAKES